VGSDRGNITYWQMLKRLPRVYAFMKKYNLLVIALVLINAARVLATAAPPLLIRYAIDELIPQRDVLLINILFGFAVLVYLTAGGFRMANTYIRWYLGGYMGYDIRKRLFDSLLVQSPRFYSKRASGEITSRLNNDVRAVEYLASQALFELTATFLQIAVSMGLLFYLSWKLTLVILALVVTMFAAVTVNMNAHKKVRKRISEKWGRILGFLQENMTNIKVVKAFCAENKEATRHTQKSRDYIKDSIRGGVIQRVFWLLGNLFWNLFVLGAIVVGVRYIGNGEISLGVLFAFVMYIRNFFMPIIGLSGTMTTIVRSFVSVDRIYTYMEAPNEVVNKPGASPPDPDRGDVVFENVHFAYDKDAEPALRGVSLSIPHGSAVAFVGHSGAGKTTMINMLLRYYDPQAGSIRVGGKDLRELDLDSHRRGLAVVFQDSLLFNDTILNNIRYAKPEATQDEVDKACRDACIYEFVQELPEGYQTIIGDRGLKLSGGQRQRLSIARAVLKNPRILLLDEATSSVDSISENRIQAALDKIMRDRTTIVIAHRLTTIVNVDRIFVFEAGKVVEEGSHRELLERGGVYYELWTTQMEEEARLRRGITTSPQPA
jgi:ABC-type multidrug transport system fused ATPase/permease subunit